MIDNISSSALPPLALGTLPRADSPSKIHDAAQQFESLLIGELLKSSHSTGSGWLGTDSDDAGQTGISMGEEQLARMLSASGGLGLARLLESGLHAEAVKGTNGSV